MTEEDKKAIEYLEDSFKNTVTHKEKLNIIKNLIKSQQKEMKILKSKRVNMFEQLDCIDKKNKMINEMARFIEERIDECPYDFWIEAEKELNCENCEEDYAKCWKQYFEKKVEEEINRQIYGIQVDDITNGVEIDY